MKSEIKKKIAQLIILTVIVVLLQLIGNNITIGTFSVSLILLPVVIGAVLCGPWGGAWLGFVFGAVILLSGGADDFFFVSPFATIVAVILRGVITGFSTGLVYTVVSRKKEELAVGIASITAPVMNTLLFIISILVFFYDEFEVLEGSGKVLQSLITTYAGVNFFIELALNMVLAPVIIHIIKDFGKVSYRKESFSKENRRKLATGLTVAVILLGVIICTVSMSTDYKNTRTRVEEQYKDTAYKIAETAKSYLDTDRIRQCCEGIDAKETAGTEEYQNTYHALEELRKNMGANNINVSVVTADGCKNIFDCNSEAKSSLSLGQSVDVELNYSDIIENDKRTVRYPDSVKMTTDEEKSEITAVIGISEDDSALPFAIISATVPVDAINSMIRDDITRTTVIMICIEIIFITLYFYYVSARVIKPINIISREVSRFVRNKDTEENAISEITSHDELQQLAEDLVGMEKDIGNYITEIMLITAEQERIGAELNVARKIQADMLPTEFPAYPDRTEFDIFASMTPAKEVGGDFYDFFMLDEDHIVLLIADVSGKGVPAALFMVVAKTLLKNQTGYTPSPKEILEEVNNQLCENNNYRMFVTVWLGIMEISTGKCVAANAGHEYPAIRNAEGDFELMKDKHGFVLAGMKDSPYTEYEFIVEKGGSLFVYTDGVPEAVNPADEQFGTDRMIEALNVNNDRSPEEIINNVKTAIDYHAGDVPQFDDITMLCIRRS